ncbi:MAG TPA: hypothetical protein VNQ77_11400 [Frankiaceae bacterium]|nr:hypothetical protein [Frankiaceae bacterium]
MLKTITRSSVVLAAVAAGVALSPAASAVVPGHANEAAVAATADALDTVPVKGHKGPRVANVTHGTEVSELATTTELTGADKGAAIAAVASDGRSAARGESASATGTAKAAEASAKGQEKSAGKRP